MLTLPSALYNIGSHLPFLFYIYALFLKDVAGLRAQMKSVKEQTGQYASDTPSEKYEDYYWVDDDVDAELLERFLKMIRDTQRPDNVDYDDPSPTLDDTGQAQNASSGRPTYFLLITCKFVFYYYYRAMHFSAKRGIAIACRLSVCLSVCNVGEL